MSDIHHEELISAYLDGELDAENAAEAERLLKNDAACRRLFDELGALRTEIQSLPRHRLDEGFRARVLRQAEIEMLTISAAGYECNGAADCQTSPKSDARADASPLSSAPPSRAVTPSQGVASFEAAARSELGSPPVPYARWRAPIWIALAAAASIVVMISLPGSPDLGHGPGAGGTLALLPPESIDAPAKYREEAKYREKAQREEANGEAARRDEGVVPRAMSLGQADGDLAGRALSLKESLAKDRFSKGAVSKGTLLGEAKGFAPAESQETVDAAKPTGPSFYRAAQGGDGNTKRKQPAGFQGGAARLGAISPKHAPASPNDAPAGFADKQRRQRQGVDPRFGNAPPAYAKQVDAAQFAANRGQQDRAAAFREGLVVVCDMRAPGVEAIAQFEAVLRKRTIAIHGAASNDAPSENEDRAESGKLENDKPKKDRGGAGGSAGGSANQSLQRAAVPYASAHDRVYLIDASPEQLQAILADLSKLGETVVAVNPGPSVAATSASSWPMLKFADQLQGAAVASDKEFRPAAPALFGKGAGKFEASGAAAKPGDRADAKREKTDAKREKKTADDNAKNEGRSDSPAKAAQVKKHDLFGATTDPSTYPTSAGIARALTIRSAKETFARAAKTARPSGPTPSTPKADRPAFGEAQAAPVDRRRARAMIILRIAPPRDR